MNVVFSVALVLHVLAATFWAGSTFALARTRGTSAEQLYGAQMAAAAVSVIAGAYLWAVAFGDNAHLLLKLGSASAIIAAVVQAVVIGRVRRRIATDAPARARAALAHRVAATFLAFTIVTMVIQ